MISTGETPEQAQAYFRRYAIGAYETFLNTWVSASYNLDSILYWDRTFISAYVYKSLDKQSFDYLLELMYELNHKFLIGIVFVDMPVEVCLERLEVLRKNDPKYRDYIKTNGKEDMMKVQRRFYEVLSILSNHGFIVEIV